MARASIWVGRALVVGALGAWLGWLAWSLTSSARDAIGLVVLTVQFVAFAAALVVSAGLWLAPPATTRYARTSGRPTPMPVLVADALGLDRTLVTLAGRPDVAADDTGEVAWARRGVAVLAARNGRPGPGSHGVRLHGLRLREAAWSVVAVDGLRRAATVAVLVAVLFTGRAPFDRPAWHHVALLVGGVAGVSVGHWLLSGGRLRPGARLVWSMASVGAGLGDGRSRSGMPIRWAATMATMVVLNLAVGLRGLSDRWTHGLGPMAHDARVGAMSVAVGHVLLGLLALRSMPRPELGFYGANGRLEETSTRRLALGGTIAVAALGFLAGALPVDGPT